jgi:hypothetical protein
MIDDSSGGIKSKRSRLFGEAGSKLKAGDAGSGRILIDLRSERIAGAEIGEAVHKPRCPDIGQGPLFMAGGVGRADFVFHAAGDEPFVVGDIAIAIVVPRVARIMGGGTVTV